MRYIMGTFVPASIVTLSLGAAACTGAGYSSGNPSAPTAPTTMASTPSVVTIDIMSINGAQSFSPNPATIPPGTPIVWRNVDHVTHRVVLNDRSLDTGDLAPGTSSDPMILNGASGDYHCSIHPSMVGSLNRNTVAAPTPDPVPSY